MPIPTKQHPAPLALELPQCHCRGVRELHDKCTDLSFMGYQKYTNDINGDFLAKYQAVHRGIT
eukprot:scaffold89453_cov31-Prasinocladus_malaysianus.AAC.1